MKGAGATLCATLLWRGTQMERVRRSRRCSNSVSSGSRRRSSSATLPREALVDRRTLQAAEVRAIVARSQT
jgi:hypothetical protein